VIYSLHKLSHISELKSAQLVKLDISHLTVSVIIFRDFRQNLRDKSHARISKPCVESENRPCIKPLVPVAQNREREDLHSITSLLGLLATYFPRQNQYNIVGTLYQAQQRISTMEKPSLTESTHELETACASASHSTHDLKSADADSETATDVMNPRNWTQRRKTLLFVSLMTSSLLADGYVWPVDRRNTYRQRRTGLNSYAD
jgi:hypothetical protein